MDLDSLRSRDFHRILLIKLSAFGDAIHTLPVLHQVRRRYPNARIDWLIKPAIADLIRHHPAIDRIIPFDDAAWRRPWKTGVRPAVRALASLRRELRLGRYDLVIDLQGQLRSAACALVAGAPVRIGFARPNAGVRAASVRALPATAYRHAWMGAREGAWLAYTHTIPLDTLDIHAVDRYLRLGKLLGFEPAGADFSFPIAAKSEAAAAALWRESRHDGGDGAVLIAPGTLWQTKQWTLEGFAAVARHFLGRGLPVALIGATGDQAVCQAVAQLVPGIVDLCGRTSLGELAAVMRRAAVVVANDSGPMHLAVALGRPVIGIFGPTDAIWVGPYGRPEAALSAGVACSPCYLRKLRQCPNRHACMHLLSPAAVVARAEALMEPAYFLNR